MLDTMALCLIARQPGDRANGAWSKKKAIGKFCTQTRHSLRQQRQEGNTRTVIVSQRRMAYMRRKQELIRSLALVHMFAVGQVTIRERRVDHHFVTFVPEALQRPVGHTKSPVLRIVRGSVGD